MTFAEYPCEADGFANCHDEFKQFHTTVYFIVVTLSTVGYGDITAGTNFGRMLVIVIIVLGLISVPLQINKVVAITTPPPAESATEKHVRELHSHLVPHPVLVRNGGSADNIKPSGAERMASLSLSGGQLSLAPSDLMWIKRLLRERRTEAELQRLCSALGVSGGPNSDTAASTLGDALFGAVIASPAAADGNGIISPLS